MKRFKERLTSAAPQLVFVIIVACALAIRFWPKRPFPHPDFPAVPTSWAEWTRLERGLGSENDAENIFVFLVGVDDYQNDGAALSDLRYACSDVLKLKNALIEKVGVPEENVLTLLSSDQEKEAAKRATRANIEREFALFLQRCDEDSTVLVALMGHGFATASGETAFAPEDVALTEKGALVAATATSITALAESLRNVPAKAKALIVDACRTTAATWGTTAQGTFWGDVKLEPTGLITLQSCSARETSYEMDGGDFSGGVFTHFLVEGLDKKRKEDGSLSLVEVGGYASAATSKYVGALRKKEKSGTDKEEDRVFKTPQSPTCHMVAGADFYLSAPNREEWFREGRALAWGLDGTKIDGFRALELLTKAANAGLRDAQAELAFLYYCGCEATPPDFKQAVYWASRAGDENPVAQNVLGDCYRNGLAVRKDEAEAKRLHEASFKKLQKLAENDGDPLILNLLGRCCYNGRGTVADFDAAAKYWRLAAKRCALGLVNWGDMRANGLGVERDYAEAIRLYNDAIELNCSFARVNLGLCYYYGLGVERDYDRAFQELEIAKNKNEGIGVAFLGTCYEFGHGVDKDLQKALQLYELASQWNEPRGMVGAGWCYFTGRGVKKDQARALELFRRAAEQDYRPAFEMVAICYENGCGALLNEETAAKWLERAFRKDREYAEAGGAFAMRALGEDYYLGKGVEKDDEQALYWYRKSVEKGDPWAICKLGAYYCADGDKENDEEATRYLRQAEKLGVKYATYHLGNCYYYEIGVKKDIDEALRLYRAAAENDIADAMVALGCHYYLNKDYEETVRWLRQAAELNHSVALDYLANCYCNNEGVARDEEKAFELFRRAVDLGNPEAMFNLAMRFYSKNGVKSDVGEMKRLLERAAKRGYIRAYRVLGDYERKEKNYEEALKWYRKGEEAGDAESVTQLGRCYENAWGAPKDLDEAERLYRKAAEEMAMPDPDAMNRLGLCYYENVFCRGEARRWFVKAAKQGHINGFLNLGAMYNWGEGVKKDKLRAARLYKAAARLGSDSALRSLGMMSFWDTKSDPQKTAYWLRKAAKSGNKEARVLTGIAAVWNELPEKMKTVLAVDDLPFVCANGFLEEIRRRQLYLGALLEFDSLCVELGSDGFTDEEKCAKLGEQLDVALKALGEGINAKTGCVWLRQAAKDDEINELKTLASFALSWCRLVGVGGRQSYREAKKYMLQAASGDEPCVKRYAELALENWDKWREMTADDFEISIDWEDKLEAELNEDYWEKPRDRGVGTVVGPDFVVQETLEWEDLIVSEIDDEVEEPSDWEAELNAIEADGDNWEEWFD